MREYGITVSKDVMVTMRDGIRLAADIYRPALPDGSPAPGVFPTILGRTSYDKANPPMWVNPVPNFFTPRGYVTVLQDMRGRGGSEGVGQYYHVANVNEGKDGYDTIEWIAAQDWSNGRVGMVGYSHNALAQTCAALYRPPHLTALWSDVVRIRGYETAARPGGAMMMSVLGAVFLHTHDMPEIRNDLPAKMRIEHAVENLRDLVWQTPFKPGHTALAVVPNMEDTFFNYYYRSTIDDWWNMESVTQYRHLDRYADIPVTVSTGWFDPNVRDSTLLYTELARKNTATQRLIVGPWSHESMKGSGTTHLVDVDFGAASSWGDTVYNSERLRWFDKWLKQVETGVDEEPQVRVFVMGGGSGRKTRAGHLDHGGVWRSEREWPLSRARAAEYFLHPGGLLSTESPIVAAGDAQSAVSWTHDPANPVPCLGGPVTGFHEWITLPEGMNSDYLTPRARMHDIIPDGPMHQRERPGLVGCRPPYPLLAERPDVMVFQTQPLEWDIEVTGEVGVKLWISSSALDTDFTAKLLDVYPPNEDYPEGYHLYLTDFILRARFRDGFDHEELMQPGQIYGITITLPPTSNRFVAGHRIRVDIASSNFPRFEINPNTGEPLGRHTGTVKARNTIHFDTANPSRIVLPLIA